MTSRTLIRPFNYTNQYRHWLLKDYKNSLSRLKLSFESEVFGDGSREALFQKQANSIVFIWQPAESEPDETNFLVDFFREILIQLQYYCSDADERKEAYDGGYILTIHRYRMLPLQKNSRQFGNITLESGFTHYRSIALRITAEYKSGDKPASFETLMEHLLADAG